jgi:hypothetical protein
MHVSRLAVSVCIAFSFLTSCDDVRTLDMRLPQNTPLEVIVFPRDPEDKVLTHKKTVMVQPDTPEYRRFEQWFASNQRGWRKVFMEKGPFDGIRVWTGDLRFHFHLRGVTLSTGGKTFYKEISEEEYAFLKAPLGI